MDVVGVLRLAGGGKGCCVCCRASYLVCVAEGVWLGVFLLAFLCCCWWRDEHLTVYGVMWRSRGLLESVKGVVCVTEAVSVCYLVCVFL